MTPRYYQNDGAESAINYFMKGNKGNPIIALPTGTGKSIIIAWIIYLTFFKYGWTNERFLVLTHVKELVGQNAKKMALICPQVSIGINCDGLNRRDTMQPVIFGSIGSVVSMMTLIGWRDIIIIDECHRVTPKEQALYSQIIIAARLINPRVKVIGLTATPYTNKGSMITYNEKDECDSLFTDICYDRTKPEDFAEFVMARWLAPLTAKPTKTKYDISNVGMTGGEFNAKQLQAATDKELLTRGAVTEIINVANAEGRHCGLVFGSGIEHAEHICEEFIMQGVSATCIHSKLSPKVRDDRLEGFMCGEYHVATNNGVLTTGFDHPPIDLLAVIRHTMSVPLWVQMLGRGTRPYDWNDPEQYIPGFEYTKHDCRVMDFAENTSRLGPIDRPHIPKNRKKGAAGDAPVKICPDCESYNYAGARECVICGFEFSFEIKYESRSSNETVMTLGEIETEWLNVSYVNYSKIQKSGSPNILQVIYHSGSRKVSEVVCLEHTNAAKRFAASWWFERAGVMPPETVDIALINTHKLRRPSMIEIIKDGSKYPKIKSYHYAD